MVLLSVKSQQFEVIQAPVSDPVALTFDVARQWYYWADKQGNIYRSDGQHSATLYSGQFTQDCLFKIITCSFPYLVSCSFQLMTCVNVTLVNARVQLKKAFSHLHQNKTPVHESLRVVFFTLIWWKGNGSCLKCLGIILNNQVKSSLSNSLYYTLILRL